MEINLELLKPSRKRLHVGDIFVLKPRGHPYYFGRVIRLDAKIGIMEKCIMIYIHNAASVDKHEIPVLDKDKLLVAPIMTNRLGWSRGYFETVANEPLREDDVLRPNCFYSYTWRRYYDEYSHELPERIEPCGEYGLHSFRTIDDEVSKALGIPLAPD